MQIWIECDLFAIKCKRRVFLCVFSLVFASNIFECVVVFKLIEKKKQKISIFVFWFITQTFTQLTNRLRACFARTSVFYNLLIKLMYHMFEYVAVVVAYFASFFYDYTIFNKVTRKRMIDKKIYESIKKSLKLLII